MPAVVISVLALLTVHVAYCHLALACPPWLRACVAATAARFAAQHVARLLAIPLHVQTAATTSMSSLTIFFAPMRAAALSAVSPANKQQNKPFRHA
jgi:hypothetical protein